MVGFVKLLFSFDEHHLAFWIVGQTNLLPEWQFYQNSDFFFGCSLVDCFDQVRVDEVWVWGFVSSLCFLLPATVSKGFNNFANLFELCSPLEPTLSHLLLLGLYLIKILTFCKTAFQFTFFSLLVFIYFVVEIITCSSFYSWILNSIFDQLLHFQYLFFKFFHPFQSLTERFLFFILSFLGFFLFFCHEPRDVFFGWSCEVTFFWDATGKVGRSCTSSSFRKLAHQTMSESWTNFVSSASGYSALNGTILGLFRFFSHLNL